MQQSPGLERCHARRRGRSCTMPCQWFLVYACRHRNLGHAPVPGMISQLTRAVACQVHGAVLHDGQRVVLKIQYPGVARSISSDVDNLMRIISIANILPKGLYVEQAATVGYTVLLL